MFYIFIFLFIHSAYSVERNVINFSVKTINKEDTINAINVLDEKFESILKFVDFKQNGNSSKLSGRVLVRKENDRVVLQLDEKMLGQNELLISLRNRNDSSMTIHTDSYKMKVSTAARNFKKELQKGEPNGCSCIHGNCACCLQINVPEFKHSVCVNATYNPISIGLDLSIGVDGHFFTEEISIRNPPPICFSLPIPGAEHIAGVCVAFEDLDLDKKSKVLSGCVDFEVELVHLRLLKFKIGCFKMPI